MLCFFRRHREVARKKPAAALAPADVPKPVPHVKVEVVRTPPSERARREQAAGSAAPARAPIDDSGWDIFDQD